MNIEQFKKDIQINNYILAGSEAHILMQTYQTNSPSNTQDF
jgi:hypothetical protein